MEIYSKCNKFFPNHPENTLFSKRRFPDLSGKNFYQIQRYVDAVPHITDCTGCNKASEHEKTSGNRYKSSVPVHA
jgi:hypothetical protein